jgi:hypothetical protein
MPVELPFYLNLSHWPVWAVFVAGAFSASLTFVVGRMLYRKPRRSLPPAPKQQNGDGPDPFINGSASERRRSLRRTGKPVKVFISDEEGQKKPVEGWVVDRSMGGLCLTVDQPAPLQSILTVRTVTAPSDTPWVQVEVKRCQPSEDRWELGCAFIRKPAWAVLLQFG